MRALAFCAVAMVSACSLLDEISGPAEQRRQFKQAEDGNSYRQAQNDAKRREEAAKEAEREKVRDAAREEEAKTEELAKAEAIKRGYKAVSFNQSLMTVIELMQRGDMPLETAKTIVINLGDKDTLFTALQVVDQNNVLFQHQHADFIVWLKNYKKKGGDITWLEGARLRAMDYNYVAITGVKTYGTVIGSRQAIVVEPVF